MLFYERVCTALNRTDTSDGSRQLVLTKGESGIKLPQMNLGSHNNSFRVSRTISELARDYLEAIYEIQFEAGQPRARTSELAKRLGVSAPTVSSLHKRVASSRPRLVHSERYRGVKLTSKGKEIAFNAIRRRRLLARYLNVVLGYPVDAAGVEADRLKHILSRDLEHRMEGQLGREHSNDNFSAQSTKMQV